MIERLLILGSIIFLAGCASSIEKFKEWTGYYSLTQEQCLTGDWYGIGYNDGRADKPYSLLHKHRLSCQRFNIFPTEIDYKKGFDAGYHDFVQAYCLPANAYTLGRQGEAYKDICPGYLQGKFLREYEKGFSLYAEEYCQPENGFKLGKEGKTYKNICPAHLESPFKKAYQKGKKYTRLKDDLYVVKNKIKQKEREIEHLVDVIEDIKANNHIGGNMGIKERHKIKRLERDIEELNYEKRRIQKLLDTIDHYDIRSYY